MTRNEVEAAAKINATQFVERLSEADLRVERDDIKRRAIPESYLAASTNGLRDGSANWTAYCELFVAQAMSGYFARRNELPDIKAANKAESIVRFLNRNIEGAKEGIDKWRENLDKNPADAFEWSDGTFKEAARLDAFTRLLSLFRDAREADASTAFDVTLAETRQQVVRGAKYGSHSTSTPSNLMAEYKLAAYAEFYDFMAEGVR